MIVLPAIDIKNGKCVRLRQGLKDDETIYFKDPVNVAKNFEDIGAEYIHIVDLDGAFDGKPKNLDLIKEISKNINIPFEIGGGIRTKEIADEYIKAGASRIIIGTKAIEDPNFVKELVDQYGDKIAVSLDTNNNKVATKGWTEDSDIDVFDKVKDLEEIGVKTIIYTDISRDGMLTGPNFKTLKELQDLTDMNIIASGGIANTEHLDECENLDLYGAITGKAIYEKEIDLEEYLKSRSKSC